MSFTNQTKKNTYSGDGVTASFAFSFPILEEDDLLVQIKDTNGTVTNKTITTEYTVNGTGNRTGFTDYTSGNVVFTAGNIPLSTDTIIIKRDIPLTQETDYTENGRFPAESHERALDKLTFLQLQQQESIDQSPKFDSDVSFSGTLPDPSGDKYIKFDSAGTGFEAVTLSSSAGLGNIVEDTTPQLGGDLDCNGKNIQLDDNTGIEDDSGNEQLVFQKTASAVNHVEITNAATGSHPSFTAVGDDADIDLTLDGKGTGVVKTTSSNLDVTGDIVVSGTVDGRDVATDGTKLDGIETAADVTDETNVKAALDGATITGVTAVLTDKILLQDVDDSDNLRQDTAQDILGLATSVDTVRAYAGSDVAIATATATKVQLNTEDFDTASSFDSTTNYRWTPQTAGKYLVTGSVYISNPADGALCVVYIYKNGSPIAVGDLNAGGATEVIINTTTIVEMNGTTDYLELYARQDSGSNRNVVGNSIGTFMAGYWIGD